MKTNEQNNKKLYALQTREIAQALISLNKKIAGDAKKLQQEGATDRTDKTYSNLNNAKFWIDNSLNNLRCAIINLENKKGYEEEQTS